MWLSATVLLHALHGSKNPVFICQFTLWDVHDTIKLYSVYALLHMSGQPSAQKLKVLCGKPFGSSPLSCGSNIAQNSARQEATGQKPGKFTVSEN